MYLFFIYYMFILMYIYIYIKIYMNAPRWEKIDAYIQYFDTFQNNFGFFLKIFLLFYSFKDKKIF